ncbi:MAG: tetratricopeptide repeat protein [Saprospiraceae bacterium]|uniref:Tetratricopeptide repeat protein n=1 Tax=Candidatus Opimibacter skivensis TaxID=2982028 RepID=A0A9D7SZE5_9BACT|nr:tetratricopeptide repeat protein [Candidatus Opimibacter skivensis]
MKKIFFVFVLALSALGLRAQTIEEGIKYMENENFTAALNTFNAICKSDPKAYQAYFYIGEVNYLMENYAEAEKSYKKGLASNAQCAECNVGLGKLELDKNNTVEAEKYFASALKINKKSSLIPSLIGDAYLQSKKPNAAKAIENLAQARSMDPKVAKYWAHLGDAYLMSGDNGEAMTAYETAVEKDPTNTEAYISIARIWANAKQTDLAIPKLEEAIRLSPNDARPIKDLYELYIREKKYDKVTPLLEKYVELTGSDVDAKVRLVKFLTFQAKDYERANMEGEKLLLTNPEEYTLHRWLAWSHYELGQYKDSYEHSNKLFDEIEKKPDRKAFPSDYEYWAKAAFKLGDLEHASHIYRKYLEFEPSRSNEIYGLLAKAYYDSSNYVQAINYYKRKGEIKPLSNQDAYWLGLAFDKQKQYPQADSIFAIVVAATPNYAQGWWLRAKTANKIDTISNDSVWLAKPFYEKYIELVAVDSASIAKNKTNLMAAYYYLAYHWVQQEDFVKAKEYYNKILELDPAEETAIDALKILKQKNR